MRRYINGNQSHLLQAELLASFFGKPCVSFMYWVKRAAKDSYRLHVLQFNIIDLIMVRMAAIINYRCIT